MASREAVVVVTLIRHHCSLAGTFGGSSGGGTHLGGPLAGALAGLPRRKMSRMPPITVRLCLACTCWGTGAVATLGPVAEVGPACRKIHGDCVIIMVDQWWW
jgi:hypothetical protein